MAETSQLLIQPIFNLNASIPVLSIQDTTGYVSINPTYTEIFGIFEIISPSNVTIYKNTDYDSSDITYSNRIKSGIVLPRDSNGNVVQGNYRIFYQVLVDGDYHYKNFTFNYVYTKPIADISIVADGYNSNLNGYDDTNYSIYVTNSIARTLTIAPPTGSGLAIQTGDYSIITYNPNIWSGTWTLTLSTVVEYNINSIYIQDTIAGSLSKSVYKINMDVIRDYIDIFHQSYITALNTNFKLANQLLITLNKIYGYVDLYNFAVLYNDYLEAYQSAEAIIALLSPIITSTQEIIPFVDPGGGGTPPIDDKWNRISGVISPLIITDKVAIGQAGLVGSEYLRVNGRLSATDITLGLGDGTQYIGVDGSNNLTFTDGVSGTKTLAQLLLGWQPLNYVLLATYTQSESNLASAVSLKHSILTIASGVSGILTLSGQELSIIESDASHAGYLSSTNFSIFNGKQAGNTTLTSLAGLSLVSGDILYSTGANALTKLAKGTLGQVLVQGVSYPEWYTLSGLTPQGSDTQVIFNSGGNYTGDSSLTYTSAQQLLYAYYITTEQINLNTTGYNIHYDTDGELWIEHPNCHIELRSDGIYTTEYLAYLTEPTLTDPLQIVYKGYVDSLVAPTFGNGLTLTGTVVTLGGTTTEATTITGNYDFILDKTTELSSIIYHQSQINFHTIDGYNGIDLLSKYNWSATDYYQTKITQEYNSITLEYTDTYNTDTASVIFDTNGLSYGSDLSSKNTTNDDWLTDKRYVDSKNIGVSVTCLAPVSPATSATEYIILGSSTTYDGFILGYVAKRGSRLRSNDIKVIHNGSDVVITDAVGITTPEVEDETCGFTISGRIYDGNVELGITVNNSDMIDVTFKYTIQKY